MGVDEAVGGGVVEGGFGAIAFAGVAVALGAFVQVDGAGGDQGSARGSKRIFAELGFVGDFPFAVFVKGDDYGNANHYEKKGEEQLAESEIALGVGYHGQGLDFRTGKRRTKDEENENAETRSAQKKRNGAWESV